MTTVDVNCAQEILEVVPIVMRAIRNGMRQGRSADLSVPQFRALLFIQRNSGASLSEVADHLGLTLPSTSTLVDGLVQRSLVTRVPVEGNRRRIRLALTDTGRPLLEQARQYAQEVLAQRLCNLTEDEQQTIVLSMELLHKLFQPANGTNGG